MARIITYGFINQCIGTVVVMDMLSVVGLVLVIPLGLSPLQMLQSIMDIIDIASVVFIPRTFDKDTPPMK